SPSRWWTRRWPRRGSRSPPTRPRPGWSWSRSTGHSATTSCCAATPRAAPPPGAAIVAPTPAPFCPTQDGGLPDCAAMLAALEACTGARAEAVVGKPSRHMVAAVLDRLDVAPEATAGVGDRPATDVAMGQSIGASGILVLSGATSAAEAAAGDVRPDHTL